MRSNLSGTIQTIRLQSEVQVGGCALNSDFMPLAVIVLSSEMQNDDEQRRMVERRTAWKRLDVEREEMKIREERREDWE